MMVDSVHPDKDLAKHELLLAIAYFIDRQSLVAQLITDLGLNIAAIGAYGPGAWGWNPEQSIPELQRALDSATSPELYAVYVATIRAHELRIPQQGIWHDQHGQLWSYYFHGIGCQIKNVLTQEVIDWDCPNVSAFDPFFFEEHLSWQLANERIAYPLGHLRYWIGQTGLRSIQQLIDELIDEGYINRDMTLSDRK
jgi:hypothetical protein